MLEMSTRYSKPKFVLAKLQTSAIFSASATLTVISPRNSVGSEIKSPNLSLIFCACSRAVTGKNQLGYRFLLVQVEQFQILHHGLFADFFLQFHQRIQQCFWPWRTSADIDVNG